MSWWHSTDAKLPRRFKVKGKSSTRTRRTMKEEYGTKGGGLFVSENKGTSKVYGKRTYKVRSSVKPRMLDNGKYIIPKGAKVQIRATKRKKV